MNKIRTEEELFNKLSEDIAWRKKELSAIKSLIASNSLATPSYNIKRRMLIRAGITMTYAHFEGFVKNSAELYLNFISFKKLKLSELKPSFVAVSLKGLLSANTGSSMIEGRIEIVKFLINSLEERATNLHKESVSTKSNLSSKILQDIILMLDLDYGPFRVYENLIDENLLGKRNAIAHGNYEIMETDQFIEMQEKIVGILEELFDQITNAAVLKKYVIL